MRALLIACFFTFASASFGQDAKLSFSSYGKELKTEDLEALKKAVGSKELTVWEPHESKNVTYVGIPANAMLEHVYGAEWQKAEEIVLKCADGYQASIPLARFKTFTAYFAFARKDKKSFQVQNHIQHEKDVPLGPLYLIWDNIKSQELKDLGAGNWPYQLVGFDLVNFADRFPKMAPPKGSPEPVQRGFVAFRNHCMMCHTINGEGGAKAPELNYPVNITEYIPDAWLTRWILDSRSIRHNTAMPAFKDLPNSKQKVSDIIAYFKAMAKNKKHP